MSSRQRIVLGVALVAIAAAVGLLLANGDPLPALLLAAVPAGALLLTRRLDLALLGYAATRPLADLAVFTTVGPFTLGQLWGAGLITLELLFLVMVLLRQDPDRERPSLLPVAFVLLYALLTVWRFDSVLAVSNTLKFASWILLAVCVEYIAQSPRSRRNVLFAALTTGVLVLGTVAVAALNDQYGAAYYAGEFLDVGQGPHGLASIAVMVVPFVLLDLQFRKKAWFDAMLLLGLTGAVVFSFVRTALVALGILYLAYVWLTVRSRRPRYVVTLVSATAAAVAFIYSAQETVVSRLSDLSFLSAGGGAAIWAGGGRVGIWSAVLAEVVSAPLTLFLGGGAGTSFAVVYQAMGASVWAHNDFLEMLATGGLVLLFGYIVLLVWTTAAPRRLRKRADDRVSRDVGWIALAAVAAYAWMAFFNGMALYQASIVFALLLGFVRGGDSPRYSQEDGELDWIR